MCLASTKNVRFASLAFEHEPFRYRDEYGMMMLQFVPDSGIRLDRVEGVIISSVVPPLMFAMENFAYNI